MIVIEGLLTRDDQARSPYSHVPIEIPARAGALRIAYAYDLPMSADLETRGNTIDLGLFEPGSLDFGSEAFRG